VVPPRMGLPYNPTHQIIFIGFVFTTSYLLLLNYFCFLALISLELLLIIHGHMFLLFGSCLITLTYRLLVSSCWSHITFHSQKDFDVDVIDLTFLFLAYVRQLMVSF
jgi:hypothetical protein